MERLTRYSQFSGCAAKLGPCVLNEALAGLAQPEYPELLVDFRTADDAGVYRVSDDLALVQTVDFFPPMVDDPFIFGQVAAANALSDVYAMGGRPVSALSLVAFPAHSLDLSILRQIMEGGMDKLREAEVPLLGGHSIQDEGIKFGFAVTGLIHPNQILRNNSVRAGDALILTKPLGNGIVNTAIRNEQAPEFIAKAAIKYMIQLNRVASECALQHHPSAMTDVTGFGLLGHGLEMVRGTSVGLRIHTEQLPLLPGTMELALEGMVPGGTWKNRDYIISEVDGLDTVAKPWTEIVCDPQTSGGLLIAVEPVEVDALLHEMKQCGVDARCIGETTSRAGRIELV